MGYIDLAVALSTFILVIGIVISITLNYFSKIPTSTGIDIKRNLTKIYENFFKREEYSERGVLIDVYKSQILVKEDAGIDREEEPVEFFVVFDEFCTNKSLNESVRVWDEDFNELPFNFTYQGFCSWKYLRNASLTFNLNISSFQKRKFTIFYNNLTTIIKNYTLSYNTTSWIPSDGDAWTESVNGWAVREGNANINLEWKKKVGNYAINMTGNFSSNSLLSLEYNPEENITGVENGWYIRAWLFVEDVSKIKSLNISISDNNEVITKNLTEIKGGEWYLFEEEISSSNWYNWTNFNSSLGIDFVKFSISNKTSETTGSIRVDGLRFEKKPLKILVFPEKKIEAIFFEEQK
ncbi:MAG: hypothetical protein QXX38_02075 [Candidatus Aenigmatarchaeota archaeon]